MKLMQYFESLLLLNGAAIVLMQTNHATIAYLLLALSIVLSALGIKIARETK
ncbi:hypothetical protein [Streptococcus macacae]|uniref:Uncharacterized protein n=1 Tax=Streptococcus macacae NCTC 11558 TaxID=764298 RepID=G5JW16_9STRE|nr:hypothetical protein [Streptococcus macacae]EHJ53241.1 hypothetical protein STRMA_1429 [Streptococcus macacae NCTC 11558]SUN79349.1 Uncharacterised protein [Streptococcus macacae NCTC 11558]